jgi:hypothetical protein
MELEHELRSLEIEWPATPAFRLVLGEQERRRSRRPFALALVLALVALATAFAVPQSRGAILRFLHLGGETIEFVDTLPPAEERPLDANLGIAVSLAEAKLRVPGLLLPPGGRLPLHAAGDIVSAVFRYGGGEVLLSEVDTGPNSQPFLKKLAGGEWVEIEPDLWGVWLTGAPHVFFFPREPARLAGNTLVWVKGRTTYRLEGPQLSQEEALELARALRYPGKG